MCNSVTKQDTRLGFFPVNWLNAHNQLGDSVRQRDAELKPELPKPASVVMQQAENFCILKIKTMIALIDISVTNKHYNEQTFVYLLLLLSSNKNVIFFADLFSGLGARLTSSVALFFASLMLQHHLVVLH